MNISLNIEAENTQFGYLNPGDVFCNGRFEANSACIKTENIASNGNTCNAITAFEGTPLHFNEGDSVLYMKNAELYLTPFKERRK